MNREEIARIEKILTEINNGELERLKNFQKEMLSNDLFVHQYILELHNGNSTTCPHCKKPETIKPFYRKKKIKLSIMFRCNNKGCYERFSAIKNTIIRGTNNRVTKYTKAIDRVDTLTKDELSAQDILHDENISVFPNTAEYIRHKLALQGISPEKNKRIRQEHTELLEAQDSLLDLIRLFNEYTSLKMFEVRCESFFAKTAD